MLGRVEAGCVIGLGRNEPGNVGDKVGGIEPVIANNAAAAGEETLPIGVDTNPERAHHSHAGHDDGVLGIGAQHVLFSCVYARCAGQLGRIEGVDGG
ncbi:hypothetical protein D3C87_1989010 [compost metagenome]